MSDALIQKAFATRVATWAAAQTPPITVVFQNQTSNAVAPYARLFILKGETENQFMEGTHRGRFGVCQVSLFLEPNTGTARGDALSASLDAYFPVGTLIVQDGIGITLTSPFGASTGVDTSDSYFVPVSASYQSHTVTT